MSKTPFEIRSDLIHVAFRSAELEYLALTEAWRLAFSVVTGSNSNIQIWTPENAANIHKKLLDKMPAPKFDSSKQLIERAEELYKFVTKKD